MCLINEELLVDLLQSAVETTTQSEHLNTIPPDDYPPCDIVREEEIVETMDDDDNEGEVIEVGSATHSSEMESMNPQQDDHDDDSVTDDDVEWLHLDCFVEVSCPLCTCWSGTYTQQFDNHLRDHLGTAEEEPTCPNCHATYNSQEDLMRHLYNDHIDVLFPCPRCHLSFVYPLDLLSHAKQGCLPREKEEQHHQNHLHPPPNKRKYQKRTKTNSTTTTEPVECDICGKFLKDQANFEKHRLRHTSSRPHKCDECDAAFVFPKDLVQHRLIHDPAELKYECNLCDPPRRYTLKRSLQAHMERNHVQRERDHVCEVCQKRFFDVSALKKHGVIHSREKAYECGVCGQRFNRGDHLKTHSKRHQPQQHRGKRAVVAKEIY